jgi:hypothetical protein
MMVSTTNEIIGFKTVRHFVRGITVRSRSVVGNLVGGLQSIFGGQIGAYCYDNSSYPRAQDRLNWTAAGASFGTRPQRKSEIRRGLNAPLSAIARPSLHRRYICQSKASQKN